MELINGVVAVDMHDLVSIFVHELLSGVLKVGAVGTLEVGVLDESDFGVGVAEDVVSVIDRFEVRDRGEAGLVGGGLASLLSLDIFLRATVGVLDFGPEMTDGAGGGDKSNDEDDL